MSEPGLGLGAWGQGSGLRAQSHSLCVDSGSSFEFPLKPTLLSSCALRFPSNLSSFPLLLLIPLPLRRLDLPLILTG